MEKRALNEGMRVERKGEAESFVKKSICQGLFAQMKDQAQIQNMLPNIAQVGHITHHTDTA